MTTMTMTKTINEPPASGDLAPACDGAAHAGDGAVSLSSLGRGRRCLAEFSGMPHGRLKREEFLFRRLLLPPPQSLFSSLLLFLLLLSSLSEKLCKSVLF